MNRLYLLASWLTTLRSIRGLSSIVGMHRAWSARDDGRTKSRNWSDRPARRVMLVQFIHPHKRHHPLEYLRDRIHFQPLPNPSPPHHQPPKHRSLYYMCRIQLDLQQSKCRPRKVGGIPLPRLIGLGSPNQHPARHHPESWSGTRTARHRPRYCPDERRAKGLVSHLHRCCISRSFYVRFYAAAIRTLHDQ